ncbi:hypothetical protein [Halosimplex halobium]|uniref:hypothetical protein n=1 Tax=Halosimplex halobium TaxID=3396618 RepID=UPI003F54D9CF
MSLEDIASTFEKIINSDFWPQRFGAKILIFLLSAITVLAFSSATGIVQGTTAVEVERVQGETTISEGMDEARISISCTPTQQHSKINQKVLHCSFRNLKNEFTPEEFIGVPTDAITVVWSPIGEGESYSQTKVNLSQAYAPYTGSEFHIRAPPETGWYELKFEPRQSEINLSINREEGGEMVSFEFEQSAKVNSDSRYRVYTEDDLLFRQYNHIIVFFSLLVLVPGWIAALRFVYDINQKD